MISQIEDAKFVLFSPHSAKYVYDDYGRETQRVFFDVNGATVRTRVGIWDVEPGRTASGLGCKLGI
jgi:hypothetical protein